MKLEKFKEKDNKKRITIGICIALVLLIAGIIVYRSFAFYEEKKAFDVIKGQVPDQNYDLMFSFYDGEAFVETMPTENGQDYHVTVECNNGATGTWDYEAWGPVITNLTSTRTKCKLYFKEGKIQIGNYVSYTPSKTSYTTDTTYTGYTSTQTLNPSELNLWRVIQITDGDVELVSEYVSSVGVTFRGQTGYQNFVGYLNVLASQYETEGITVGSRYLGYNNQTEYITDTSALTSTTAPWTSSTGSSTVESKGGGDRLYTKDTNLVKTACGNTLVAYNVSDTSTAVTYWLANRVYYYYSSTHWHFDCMYTMANGGLSSNYMHRYYSKFESTWRTHNLRPVVIVPSSLFEKGDGTIDNPWKVN